MSQKQTRISKKIQSGIRWWNHTDDGWRRAIQNPHTVADFNYSPILPMKKRIHPTLDYRFRKNSLEIEVYSKILDYALVTRIESLKELWFVEIKKEESDMDDGWIDGAYIRFAEHMDRHADQNFEEFKEAILSHIPPR